jgi:hypothetical protein
MRYLMRVDCVDTKGQDPTYVRACDFEADAGQGRVLLTRNPNQALVFASQGQARNFWEKINRFGKAPMSKLSVELVSLEVAKLVYTNQSKILSRYR